MRPIALVVGIASAATLLAACSATSSGPTPQSLSSASAANDQPLPRDTPTPLAAISTDALTGHVHHLVLQGTTLYLGTHDGLWEQRPGEQPTRVTAEGFDVMGLTRTGTTWLASGHPGPQMQAPSDLGLVLSNDGGRTWKEESLGGQVDFHRLVASGAVVMGIDSGTGALWRSENLGRTWQQLGRPPLFDLAISPSGTSVVIGTTQNGVVRSVDSGAVFADVPSAPLLTLVSAADSGIYATGTDGRVYLSADDGISWQARGALASQPTALAAQQDTVVALVGTVVVESRDGGRTFHDRLVLSSLDGH